MDVNCTVCEDLAQEIIEEYSIISYAYYIVELIFGFLFDNILIILPICVLLVLLTLQKLVKSTFEKLKQLRRRRRRGKDPYSTDLDNALELQEKYSKNAKEELMKEIREGKIPSTPPAIHFLEKISSFEELEDSFVLDQKAKKDTANDLEDSELSEILRTIRLFQFIETAVLNELSTQLKIRKVKKGEILFGKGPNGEYIEDRSLLIILEGRVEIFVNLKKENEDDKVLLNVFEDGHTVTSMISILESLISSTIHKNRTPSVNSEDNDNNVNTNIINNNNINNINDINNINNIDENSNINNDSINIIDIKESEENTEKSDHKGSTETNFSKSASATTISFVRPELLSTNTFRSTSVLHNKPSVSRDFTHSADSVNMFNSFRNDSNFTESRRLTPTLKRKIAVKEWKDELAIRTEKYPMLRKLMFGDDSEEQNVHLFLAEENEEIITAIATKDSVMAELPLSSFELLHEKYPRAAIRLIRSIITRLQRATLLTVNQYFGLSQELLSNELLVKRDPKTASQISLYKEKSNLTEDQKLPFEFEFAFQGISALFDLRSQKSIEILRKNLQIEKHTPGSVVMAPAELSFHEESNDAYEPCLYFVLKGKLGVYLFDDPLVSDIDNEGENEEKCNLLYWAYPGDIVGQLAVITGDFYYRVTAVSDQNDPTDIITLGKLNKRTFDELVNESAEVMSRTIYMIYLQLSNTAKQFDYALDWQQRHAGEVLCNQNDPTDGMYVVLSGRLRGIKKSKNNQANHVDQLFGTTDNMSQRAHIEYGRGESFGAMEVLTDAPRPTTVIAVRDTELAKISSNMFKFVMKKYPHVVVQFSRIIGKSMRKQLAEMTRSIDHESSNLSTIAIVGVNETVPIKEFATKLADEMKKITSTLHLDKNAPLHKLGKNIFTAAEDARLIRWLGEMEEQYRVVLYECDSNITPWTKRCLRQADCILIVGWAHGNFRISQIEKFLLQNSKQTSARKELVLLHPDNTKYPKGAINWLNLRKGWCSACHHIHFKIEGMKATEPSRIQMPGGLRLFKPISGVITRGTAGLFQTLRLTRRRRRESQLFGSSNPKGDIARIARILTGTSIGLVLGGGGARGCAHVGVIQALEESGIPIDMIGGTSMGSIIGGIYAKDPDRIYTYSKARRLSRLLGNKWRQALDLTYPRVSFFTGSAMNEVVSGVLGEYTQIEDLWINYFAVTTNITHSKMMVHRHGSLWRYVRASMSLVGFLPPICDTDGSYLVDGGYVNNLPADVMRSMGAKIIIAVDVGSEPDTNFSNYGDSLSGWWLLWKKFNPWTSRVNVPNLSDIQSQLAYISTVKLLEEVKAQKNCLYVRPPIQNYATLDFHKFNEIVKVGYDHTMKEIEKWREKGSFGKADKKTSPAPPITRARKLSI